jgi:hypothetical protein
MPCNRTRQIILKQTIDFMRIKKLQLSSFLLLLTLFGCINFEAKAQVSSVKMEAVYLYNFTKYVNWTGGGDKFVIGVLGSPEMKEELDKSLTGKKVGTRDIEIRDIAVSQVIDCSIVYLGSSQSNSLATINTKIKGKNILLVTQEDLAEQGACISFFMQNGKLKFKLNQAALRDSGLKTSENLLTFATVISGQ